MRGLKKRRRVQVIAAAILSLAAATALGIYASREGFNFYREPADVAANPPADVFRLGGLVEPGSLVRGAGETVTFSVGDGAASIPVHFTGILPDLFEEGQGTIVTGRLMGGTFEATSVLAKHDEEYMPRELMETMKKRDRYRDPNAPSSGN